LRHIDQVEKYTADSTERGNRIGALRECHRAGGHFVQSIVNWVGFDDTG
jgi:hypothetical protein